MKANDSIYQQTRGYILVTNGAKAPILGSNFEANVEANIVDRLMFDICYIVSHRVKNEVSNLSVEISPFRMISIEESIRQNASF